MKPLNWKILNHFSVCSCNYQSIAKQHHYHRRKISQNCYSWTKPKNDTIQNSMFFLSQSSLNVTIRGSCDKILWTCWNAGVRVQYSSKLLPDTKFQSEILYMTGKFRTYVNPSYCVDYRNGPRYCCQRSIGWGRGDQTVYPPWNVFAYLVVLRFKTRCPKTNAVAPLNSKCLALKKNFGLATLLQRNAFLWLL